MTEQPFVIRHNRTGLYLAKNDKDVYKYGSSGVAMTIGAKGNYKWSRDINDAIVYATESEADLAWILMGEPPVDFIDTDRTPNNRIGND